MTSPSFRRWLNAIPVADPIQRQQAIPFQLVLMVALVVEMALISINIVVFKALIVAPQTLLPSLVIFLCFSSSLLLLRRGRFRGAAVIIIGAIFLAETRGILTNGLVSGINTLIVFVLPFTLAGLLVGRRALLVSFGLALGVIVFTGFTESPVPIEITTQLHAQSILANVILFVSVMGLFAVFLDRFSSALRTAFVTAAQHEQENERLYKAVDEQRQRLHITLTSIGDAVIATDSLGLVTLMNPIAETLTGWAQDQAFGRPIEEVFHIVNEETLRPLNSPVARVLAEGIVIGLANHSLLIHRNGQTTPIDDSAAPIRDQAGTLIGVVLVFRDISERRQAEQCATSLYEITSALSSAVTIHEIARVVINQGCTALGAAAGTLALLIDENTLEMVEPAGYAPEVVQTWQRFSTQAAVPAAYAVRTQQPLWIGSLEAWKQYHPGVSIPVGNQQACVALPMTLKDHRWGALVFTFTQPRSFSPADQAFALSLVQQCVQALDRAQIYEREQHARQQAERANKLKTEFLAMISHELRTPLSSIKGFSTTLLATDVAWDPDREREFVQIINDEADKLTELIDQLLDLSQLQAGTLRISRQPTTLENILTIAQPQLKVLTVHHSLVICDFEHLPLVLADAQRIAQVLVNLINNAVKYSPPNTLIEVRISVQGGMVQYDVSDQGPGIPVEDRAKVFEAFWQLGGSNNSPKMKGAGLGLAICKALIEAHEGQIWIAEHVSSGTTVSFTLPIAT